MTNEAKNKAENLGLESDMYFRMSEISVVRGTFESQQVLENKSGFLGDAVY